MSRTFYTGAMHDNGQLCMPSFGLGKMAYLRLVWTYSIDQGFCRWSPTLLQVGSHIYQKGTKKDLKGYKNYASGLCCHMLNVMMSRLCRNIHDDKWERTPAISVIITCNYIWFQAMSGHRKTPNLPKTSTVLCRKSLFYIYTWLQQSLPYHYFFFVVFLKTHGLNCFSHWWVLNKVHIY